MSVAADSVRPLRRNAVASILGRAASVVVWIAVTPYVLHRLGPERFGVWSLFFVLGGYAATLDLGMSAGVSRYLPGAVARNQRREAVVILSRSLWMSATLGLVWMLVCLTGRGLFLEVFHVPAHFGLEVRDSLTVFAVSLLVFSFTLVFQGGLMGFQRLDLWNLYFVTGLAVHATVLVTGLAMGWGLMAAAVAAVSGHSVSGLLAWRSVRRALNRLGTAGDERPLSGRELLGFGAVIQASNALGVGQMQAGKVLLGALGRLVWVTQFELGFRVANGLWSLSTLIQGAVVPAAAHASEVGGRPQVLEVYEWCCRWVFAMAAWVLGLLWLLAPALFKLWLGNPAPEAIGVARWLAVAFAASTLAGPATAVARGHGWPGLEVLNFAVALALNVLTALWLIPRLGAEGAAISMIFSFLIAAACMLAVFHRRLQISTASWLRRLAAPRLAASAASAAVLWLAWSRWPLDSRIEALGAVVLGGIAFTLLFVALTWRTGDARAVWALGRSWLSRFGVGAEIAKRTG